MSKPKVDSREYREKLVEIEFKKWHADNKAAYASLSPEERGAAIKWKLRELALRHRLVSDG